MKLFYDKGVGQLCGLAVALALIFPVLYLAILYPQYHAQLLETVKHEAGEVARHLSRMARFEGGRLRIEFGDEDRSLLLNDFGLLEIQMVDQAGRVVYSSESEDIGTVIAQDFFRGELPQGLEFAQVVAKGDATSDGMIASQDLIEVYVPIMMEGVFVGACGLYYDISPEQGKFTRLRRASLIYPLPLVLMFLGLAGFALKRLDNQIVARQLDKEKIETQHDLLLVEQEKQRHLLRHIEKAKRQWETTMDRVDDMVVVTDSDMRVRRCNKAVCAFCGAGFTEILNQRLSELFTGLDLERGKSEGRAFEYFHTGSGRWFYVTLYQSAQTDEGGWVVTAHDVTEIKKIAAELERKNAEIMRTSDQLQHAIDEISTLINRVVQEENLDVYFSGEFTKGCFEVMNCGKAGCPCYGKEPQPCWHVKGTLCDCHGAEGGGQKFEDCGKCPYFLSMTSNPIDMIGEQFNHMMHILAGKNQELHLAYSDLKQAQGHLLQQEKMASIGQLAAGVAHEINNPVGFISSNLSSLRKYAGRLADFIGLEADLLRESRDPLLLERQAEERKKFKIDFILTDIDDLIHESLDGCDRVKKIVQDLKGFSRVDQAKEQTVDIHECIDSTLNIVWNELKYKAKIDKEYQATSPVHCFPQQMNQVFMNLLVNAAHAIEKEGLITIRTWEDEAFAYIAISDTGGGIKPEHIGHVFEPFFTTKEVGKGTGLGLSIVYDIITKNHHGDIQVESQVGQGTTFTVKLPFAKAEG